MASGLTDYGANALLNHMFGIATLTPPANWYVMLYTTLPAKDGTGGVEVSGGGYARQVLAVGAAASGATDNTAILDYGTASASWGTVVGVGLADAASGGNVWWRGALTASKVVNSGDPFTIPIGELDLSFVDVA